LKYKDNMINKTRPDSIIQAWIVYPALSSEQAWNRADRSSRAEPMR
jgi:hypothetical protein